MEQKNDKTRNRAMLLGDGLFETLRVARATPLAARYHWERLSNGLELLGLQPISFIDFYNLLLAEIQRNTTDWLRLRFTAYRQGSGAYLPGDDCETVFQVQSAPIPATEQLYPRYDAPLRCGICPTVQIPCDTLSNIKTISALRYIQAARHAQAQGWDDALLLNARGHIAEATASNIFWWKNEVLHTPPLEEGCVAGIMRRLVIEEAHRQGVSLVFQPCTLADWQDADARWLTNAVRGIRAVEGREARAEAFLGGVEGNINLK